MRDKVYCDEHERVEAKNEDYCDDHGQVEHEPKDHSKIEVVEKDEEESVEEVV